MDFKIFEALGLNEKSSVLYLAGLTLGTTSVQELARKSGLKRPTVYLHMDELVKRGFFELVPINNKTYYRATDPHIFEDRLQGSLLVLQKELPKLAELRADTMGKPQVRIFEGQARVNELYTEMKTANTLRIWSNVGEIYGPSHDVWMDLCESIKENAINTREIIADTKASRRYGRLVAKVAGPTYAARTATVDGLENDAVIYGNVVALFRLSGLNIFVVRIEDKTIADSMRAIFEMAWRTARPFK